MWLNGTQPMLFAESSCACLPNFRSVVPFIFLEKVSLWAFFWIQKGMWPYRYAYVIPLVILTINIYLHSFFWQKYQFWLFQVWKGVQSYKNAHYIPLVTLILNIYGFVGLHGQTDYSHFMVQIWTNHLYLFILYKKKYNRTSWI